MGKATTEATTGERERQRRTLAGSPGWVSETNNPHAWVSESNHDPQATVSK